MRTLYIECNMGAAGDMLMAALYELIEEKDSFLHKMNSLGLAGVQVRAKEAVTCGIAGTGMEILIHGKEELDHDHDHEHSTHHHDHNHEHNGHHHEHEHSDHHHDHGHSDHHHDHEHIEHSHHHTGLQDILDQIRSFPLPQEVLDQISGVYQLLAQAESKAHGKPVDQVHFHEVGMLDAIVDITGVCYAMHLLKADKIVVSPIHVGSGQVRCAHGIMPVPAPATATLLAGIPSYGGEIGGELCTPTGAALLAHFGQQFGNMPIMKTEKVGYGVGKKQFEAANCVRIFLGETAGESDGEIVELCCTLDDMSPEALAYAKEAILAAGALDLYITPIHMKKGRSAMLLTVLCTPGEEKRIADQIFFETSTIGMRIRRCEKYYLKPETRLIKTRYGEVEVKVSKGHGVIQMKPEYDQIAAIASENQLPFQKVWNDVITELSKEIK